MLCVIFRFSNEISALSGFLQMTLFPQKEKMDNLETLKLDTIFFFWSCLKKTNQTNKYQGFLGN